MLREIATQRTDSQGYRRRWFQSEKMDLYTWHTDAGTIMGFQLAYDRLSSERAITWMRDKGFFHARVDEGRPGFVASTPFLVPASGFDAYRVHCEFVTQAAQIDRTIALLVARKLRECLVSSRPQLRAKPPRIWLVLLGGCLLGVFLRRLLK